ncbi:hypothetical protein M407DRAFT_220582, partial [Tulasnella calospora MUT 4182]
WSEKCGCLLCRTSRESRSTNSTVSGPPSRSPSTGIGELGRSSTTAELTTEGSRATRSLSMATSQEKKLNTVSTSSGRGTEGKGMEGELREGRGTGGVWKDSRSRSTERLKNPFSSV